MLRSSPSLRLASRCPSTPREVRHPRERFASAIQEKGLLCFPSSHVPGCSLRSSVFYLVRPCGPEFAFCLEKNISTFTTNPTMRNPRIHCPAPPWWALFLSVVALDFGSSSGVSPCRINTILPCSIFRNSLSRFSGVVMGCSASC